jgi:hypothetical protein
MTEHNATASVHVSLKDENGEVYEELSIPEDASLADVMDLQDESVWIEIPFEGMERLQCVELFRYMDDEIRLGFHFDIDSLVVDPKVVPSATGDEWEDTAELMEDALTEREEAIKAVLGCEELAILWGGPSDTPKPKHGHEVVYYIDDCSAFLIITQRSTLAAIDLSMQLSTLRDKAQALDVIVKDIMANNMQGRG